MKVLVCDRCEHQYNDAKDVEFAEKQKEAWAQSCRADGVEPRGVCPCPYTSCKGELVIKEI
jgi:hypothetical protein